MLLLLPSYNKSVISCNHYFFLLFIIVITIVPLAVLNLQQRSIKFKWAKFKRGKTVAMLWWNYKCILLFKQWRSKVPSKQPNAMSLSMQRSCYFCTKWQCRSDLGVLWIVFGALHTGEFSGPWHWFARSFTPAESCGCCSSMLLCSMHHEKKYFSLLCYS